MTKPICHLIIGCPSSGKSTVAKAMQDHRGYQIIERDVIREKIAGSRRDFYSPTRDRQTDEAAVSGMVASKMRMAARRKDDIVISDTNIDTRSRHRLYTEAFALGFEITVELIEVPLEELIERNNNRDEDHRVPEFVINRMYKHLYENIDLIRSEVEILNHRYDSIDRLNENITIIDIDGTIAERSKRSPYEWHRVGEDTPIPLVTNFINNKFGHNSKGLVVFTGRSGECAAETVEWLEKYTPFKQNLNLILMRPIGCNRADWVIKGRMLIDYTTVNPTHNIELILDDRQQVVNIWSNMGLPVWQVAQNTF